MVVWLDDGGPKDHGERPCRRPRTRAAPHRERAHGDAGRGPRRSGTGIEAHRLAASSRPRVLRSRPREDPTMILVDTSAWVEFFRGRDPVAQAVDAAIAS